MLRITILSISLLTVFGSAAIAPALSEIAAAFPDVAAVKIKSLLTAPAMAMAMLSPFTGCLSDRFGQKRVLLVGLVVYLLGGVGGGLAPSVEVLFFCRMLLGCGIGILMPMSSGLIAEYFSGRERLKMMGWSSSVTSFFGICANLGVGYLALLSWRYGFGIYSIAVIVLLLVLFNIPAAAAAGSAAVERGKRPLIVYAWAAAVFLQMVGIYAVPVNISLFLVETGIGGPRETGMAVACLTASGFIAGLSGAYVRDWLGRYFVFVMLLLCVFGYIMLVNSSSLIQVIAALFAVGIGNGFLMPYLFFSTTTAAKTSSVVGAMGVVATAASLGQFATPLLLDGAAHLLGDGSIRFIFIFLAWAIALAAIIVFTNMLLRRQTAPDTDSMGA